MYTLRRSSRDQLWTVGFESVNDGKWVAIDDFPDKQQAIELVSFSTAARCRDGGGSQYDYPRICGRRAAQARLLWRLPARPS